MSDLALFKNGIPAHLRNLGTDEATKALAGNKANKAAGSSMKRISIKAGVFRMIVDGKEVAQNEDRAMPIIIAAAAPHDSRTFYAKRFEEGQTVSALNISVASVGKNALGSENPYGVKEMRGYGAATKGRKISGKQG